MIRDLNVSFQQKESIPIIRSNGNTPVIRSRGHTPVIQSSENVPSVPLVPTRGSTSDKAYALFKANTRNTKNVVKTKVKYTEPYFPSIAKV